MNKILSFVSEPKTNRFRFNVKGVWSRWFTFEQALILKGLKIDKIQIKETTTRKMFHAK